MGRIKLKNKRFQIISYAVIFVVMVVAAGLVYTWYRQELKGFAPGEATFQLLGGEPISYSKDAIYFNNDGKVEIKELTGNLSTAGTPILYNVGEKLTTDKEMLLFVPDESMAPRRILQFTTITMAGGRVNYEHSGEKAQSYGGFLYDGLDTYIFLEHATLKIAGAEIELQPLSYAVVYYNDSVEYYCAGDDHSTVVELANTDVTAELDSGNTLDLGKDVIVIKGQETLLYSSVSDVKAIKMD